MKRFFFVLLLTASCLAAHAQTVIDNFRVGPYIVDYRGTGDVKYRLRDDIDLYEFFDLQKDTIIVAMVNEILVKHAFQISGQYVTGAFSSKEIGLGGVWKQRIGENLYFNGGVSLAATRYDYGLYGPQRTSVSVGVPLQVEMGKLNRQFASLYGSIGIEPAYYSALVATKWDRDQNRRVEDVTNSGFLVAPIMELGGNVPVGDVILRFGIVGAFKITCTPSEDLSAYINYNNKGMFFGAKIGILL